MKSHGRQLQEIARCPDPAHARLRRQLETLEWDRWRLQKALLAAAAALDEARQLVAVGTYGRDYVAAWRDAARAAAAQPLDQEALTE